MKEDKKMKAYVLMSLMKVFQYFTIAIILATNLFIFVGCYNGKDGRPGLDGSAWHYGIDYSIYAGTVKVGDFFIDTDDYVVYQKNEDGWAVVVENFGRPGNVGKGIISVEKTSSNGLVDTYTITFTDGSTNMFDVTNGKDGIAGSEGATWLTGVQVTGKEEISVAVSNSKVGDLYFNTETLNIYECVADNLWKYLTSLKIEKEERFEVDLVMFMGQSNMAGRGNYTEATAVAEGHGYEFRPISDPTKLYNIGAQAFGKNENNGVISESTKTGSMVPALMESYYQYTRIPIVGVSASKGGTSIDWWQPNGQALTEAISRFNTAKTWLEDNGYSVRHKYMVWCQGESDGDISMDKDTYKAKLMAMTKEMSKQGIEKTMIVRIGNHRDYKTLYDNIILAQTELCAEYDDLVMISGKLAGMAEQGLMKDEFHFTQEGYNIVGADAGKNMAYYVNTGMEPYYFDSEYKNYYPFGK